MSSVRMDREMIRALLNSPALDGIVAYKEAWQDEDSVVILMKEHQHTLRRWIGHTLHLTDEEWLEIILGIVTGLENIHRYGPHKDLKPSNSLSPSHVEFTFTVLIDRTPEGRFVSQNVYVSDWGLPYCSHFPVKGKPADVPGTYAYIAPEIFRDGETAITTKSDMWAVGCIGYELCIGQKLADNRQDLQNYVEHGESSPVHLDHLMVNIPRRFNNNVHEIIRACLYWDPQQRCSAVNLRNHIQNLGGRGRA